MTTPALRALIAGVAMVAACDNGSGPPPPQASVLHVVHAIRGGPLLTVLVDGGRGGTLAFGALSRAIPLAPGQHDLVLQPADTTHTLLVLFNTVEGVNYTVFAVDSMSGGTPIIEPVLIPDMGAVAPTGHVRLRLASFASAAPTIDAYRSQPDSVGLLRSAQPLNFRAVTPYFDGMPGDWSVEITHGGLTDTLLATGPLALTDGQARTVVVLDSTSGHVSLRLVPDRN